MATRRVLVNFEHNVVKFDVNSESDLLNSFTGSFLLSFTSTLQGPTALPKKITNTVDKTLIQNVTEARIVNCFQNKVQN